MAGFENIEGMLPAAASISESVGLENMLEMDPFDFTYKSREPSGIAEDKNETSKTKLNIAVIVGAALVFIIVIAWFEVLRVWLEYAFLNETKILKQKAIADTIYATVGTFIAISILLIIKYIFLKKK